MAARVEASGVESSHARRVNRAPSPPTAAAALSASALARSSWLRSCRPRIYALLGTIVPLLMSECDRPTAGLDARCPGGVADYRCSSRCCSRLAAAMDFLTVYGLAWVGRSVIRDLRNDVFGHYFGCPRTTSIRSSSGVLISRLTYNTEQVAEAISNAIVILLRDTFAIIVLARLHDATEPTADTADRCRRARDRPGRRRNEPRISSLQLRAYRTRWAT